MKENVFIDSVDVLGLYKGAVIEITGAYNNPFTVTNNGLVDCEGRPANDFIGNLLTGEWEFKFYQWEPRKGYEYWFIDNKEEVRVYYWKEDVEDFNLKYAGNCFPTREAAEAGKAEVLKRIGYIKASTENKKSKDFFELATHAGLYDGAEIHIKGWLYNPYKITVDGLFNCDGYDVTEQADGLFTGTDKFEILQWEPKSGDEFWLITALGIIRSSVWKGHIYDCMYKEAGNVFRTKEAAEAGRTAFYERIKYVEDAQE